MRDQVEGHQKAVDLLQSYSQNGDNSDLKKLASDVLPTVEKHLAAAQKLETPTSASR
jgi:predicted outer membrane protein